MRKLVAISGREEFGHRTLYELIKAAISPVGEVRFVEDRASQLAKEFPSDHVCLDVNAPFEAKTLASLAKRQNFEIRHLIMVRDARDVLSLQAGPGNFLCGFDHCSEKTAEGKQTYSDFGLVSFWAAIKQAVKVQRKNVSIVQYERLLSHPNKVQRKIEAFTGLKFQKSFKSLLSVDGLIPRARDPEVTQVSEKRMSDLLLASKNQSRMHAYLYKVFGTPVWADQRNPLAGARVARQFRLAPDLFEMLRGTGYSKGRRWYGKLTRHYPSALDDKPGTVVGYYTETTRYEHEARRLAASLERLGIPFNLVPVEPKGDWLATVRQKPGILLDLRRKLRGQLLYVDVDAVFHKNPWPYLRGYDGDVAVSSHPRAHVMSGTFLMNDTPAAEDFLRRWIANQEKNVEAWDQHSLENVVYEILDDPESAACSVGHLPSEMCRVFDRAYKWIGEAYVEHLQASREIKATEDDLSSQALLKARRDRVQALDRELPAVAGGEGTKYSDIPKEDRIKLTEELARSKNSDIQRWSKADNFHGNWSSRARTVAQLIGEGKRVLDIGCGQMDLEKEIAGGCSYIPSDLVKRDDRTIVCDLNVGQLPDTEADVVTMLGVMEYIHDPQSVFTALASRWRHLVLTFNPSDLDAGRDRRLHGWFCNLKSAELVEMANKAGFGLRGIVPIENKQLVYEFTLGDGGAA